MLPLSKKQVLLRVVGMAEAAGPSTPRQRPPGHMIEYYAGELASEPVLLDFYGAGFAATRPRALAPASLPDTPAETAVSEGVPPPAPGTAC